MYAPLVKKHYILMPQNTVIETNTLNASSEGFPRRYREGLFSALSAGFFFLLVGAIFVIMPNLFGKIQAFFSDFDVVRVPNTQIFLPAPASPRDHSVVYSSVARFSLVWGLYQIVVLALRFLARSPSSKKAETVSNLVFWLGANCLINIFLDETTTATTWFVFWAVIIMVVGVSLIVRAIILAV